MTWWPWGLRPTQQAPPVTAEQALAEARRDLRAAAWVRTGVLAVASVAALVTGLAYVAGPPELANPSRALSILDGVGGGLSMWGWLWVAAGGAGLFAAALGRRAVLVVGAIGSLALVWSLAYFTGWFQAGGRAYLSAAAYVAVAVLPACLLFLPHDRRAR